jgi:creatinine amidohydrolase
MGEILWERLKRTEFEALAGAGTVVIIPVASIEQHGHHLPVNTDLSACFALAQKAAQAVGEFPVLVLPPVWTGYSPHHMAHPGSITLAFHTFVELLGEIAASVAAHGFKKILFLNGHGGNGPAVSVLRTKLAAERNVSCVAVTFWDLPAVAEAMKKASQSDKGFIGHAGEMETSLQLHLQPDLVEMTAAKWVPGMWGDPSLATREKGERVFQAAVDALAETLRDYHSGRLEERLAWRREIL